jgi:hypothetical protein
MSQHTRLVFMRQGLSVGAQTGLELTILPLPPECWDYRCVPPCPGSLVYILAKLLNVWLNRLFDLC